MTTNPPKAACVDDAMRAEMDAACGHDNPLAAAYRAGWIACSRWAKRDDLIADTDSPAYIRERDAALSASAARSGGDEENE